MENTYSKTFISRLRDELLNREVFANLKEAKVLAKDYRDPTTTTGRTGRLAT